MKGPLAAIAVLAFSLYGCSSIRPDSPPDALQCQLDEHGVEDIYSDWFQVFKQRTSQLDSEGRLPSFNVLSLSAGGEFGAYGAGFLKGWRKVANNPQPMPRQDIQVVTGVSTGAILATHAFLEEDDTIDRLYEQADGTEFMRKRWWIEYLWANSLFDSDGKDALVENGLTDEIIEKVALEYKGIRRLYVGIVDLDTGEFRRIDMTKLAASRILTKRERYDCYRAVIGASSAIPVVFSPKFIDNKMWVDGGVRHHVFITEPPSEVFSPDMERRLVSFVHGDLKPDSGQVANDVLSIAGRTASITIDQLLKSSIARQEQLASSCPKNLDCGKSGRLFRTFYASAAAAADSKECRNVKEKECRGSDAVTSEDAFCKSFMQCLSKKGEEDGEYYASGKDSSRWLSFDDLCLGSSMPDPNVEAYGIAKSSPCKPKKLSRSVSH